MGVILGAAIRENYTGPVFIQVDHRARIYGKSKYLPIDGKEIISKMTIHSMQSSVTNQKKYFNELNTLLSFFLLQKHFNFFEKLFIFKRIFIFNISFFLKNLLKI